MGRDRIDVHNESAAQHEPIEFQPRPSNGRTVTAVMGFFFAGLFLAPLITALGDVSLNVAVVFTVLASITGGPLLLLAYYFPAMRYIIDGEHLVLRYGPLMNEKIPVAEIQKVQRRHLDMSWTLSFRFPGLALFENDYSDVRRVYMCASAATNDVLVIDTGRVRYGVTPDDEEGFISALQEQTAHEIEVLEPYLPLGIGR